jgi:hypothetical protein
MRTTDVIFNVILGLLFLSLAIYSMYNINQINKLDNQCKFQMDNQTATAQKVSYGKYNCCFDYTELTEGRYELKTKCEAMK